MSFASYCSDKVSILGIERTRFEMFAIIFGPVLYLIMLNLPLGGTATQQGGLGIIAWAAWYWSTGCVTSGVVMVVPIFGTAFLPGMDFGYILKTLIHPGLPMLLGPALIVCMWSRWGLTRRFALFLLSKVGTSVRAQAVAWLLLSACFSFVTANVVIAIALTPIALEILKAVGFDTPKKLLASKSCMLIIIAVGIGSTVGGFLTPMAGGQAVITWQEINNSLGFTMPMATFTAMMCAPVLLSLIPVTILFGCVFPIDTVRFEGSSEYFKERLDDMGPLSKSEVWGLVIFVCAIFLPFMQPLWQPLFPESINITPALIFALITCLLAVLPAPDEGAKVKPFPVEPNERLLGMRSIKILPLQAFLIWPTAMSMAVLVDKTGGSQLVATFLGNYWDLPAYLGTGLFMTFCIFLGNVASDTGAAGMLAPIIAVATSNAGVNPIPWLLMMGYSVNFSFMVPCACGTIALPIALEGKACWRLPFYGFFCAVGCGLVGWLFWGTVRAYDLQFWQVVNP